LQVVGKAVLNRDRRNETSMLALQPTVLGLSDLNMKIIKRIIPAALLAAMALAQGSTPQTTPVDPAGRAMAIYAWLQNPANSQMLSFINNSIASQSPATSSYIVGTVGCVSNAPITAVTAVTRLKPAGTTAR
jgi:hypothetical protein